MERQGFLLYFLFSETIESQLNIDEVINLKHIFDMNKNNYESYEAPFAEVLEIRIEGALLTGTTWDKNNKTENIDEDGDIIGL